jgi:hypothetical protein
MGIGDTYESQPGPCPLAPWLALGVREIVQEPTMIAALKQLYEHYHSKDLAALKSTYERHAEDCAQAAELTVDPRRREVYLNLAREWTEAAAALPAQTQ